MHEILASDPDPEKARTQHILLLDAAEYVRAAYDAERSYMPLAVSSQLAAWEEARRDLGTGPETMHEKLVEVRASLESGPAPEVFAEERQRLLDSLDDLGVHESNLEADFAVES